MSIGWIFEECGHVKMDGEKYRRLVEADEEKMRERKELAAVVAKEEEKTELALLEKITEKMMKLEKESGGKLRFKCKEDGRLDIGNVKGIV